MKTAVLFGLLFALVSATDRPLTQTLTGQTSFVPVDATINNDNHLVYVTVNGGTKTSIYTNDQGYLTTRVDGGREVTTTAATNIVVESYTHTTTDNVNQAGDPGQFYTTTTFDGKGLAHTAYIRDDPNVRLTTTSWDNNGLPHTYYVSETVDHGSTSLATVTNGGGETASTPTTATGTQTQTSSTNGAVKLSGMHYGAGLLAAVYAAAI